MNELNTQDKITLNLEEHVQTLYGLLDTKFNDESAVTINRVIIEHMRNIDVDGIWLDEKGVCHFMKLQDSDEEDWDSEEN